MAKRLQAAQLPTLAFGWQKIWLAFGRRSSFSANVSWNPFPFSFYCANDETLLLLTFLSFFRMWVSRVGCGRDVRHQTTHHLQWFDEHNHPCQMPFWRIYHSIEAANATGARNWWRANLNFPANAIWWIASLMKLEYLDHMKWYCWSYLFNEDQSICWG